MQKLTLFYFEACPYCRQALAWLEELKKEKTEYGNIEIEMIDERKHPEIADQYDYWYVPTFYMNGNKVHEGAMTKEKLNQVLDGAL